MSSVYKEFVGEFDTDVDGYEYLAVGTIDRISDTTMNDGVL